MKRSFLILSANTPWVYALAEALSAHAAVTAVQFYDWTNYSRLKPQWPETASPVRRRMVRLPPGYAGRFEPAFRPLVQSIIGRELSRLRRKSDEEPIVVCPYPYLAPWVRSVPGGQIVYYNLDDYALYDPSQAFRTAALEDELIRRARLTLCLSVYQVRALRSRHPQDAERIAHFPLGVVRGFLNLASDRRPLVATIGYVGNLTNRVDWHFVERVTQLVPEARFHFIGELDAAQARAQVAGWQQARARVMALPNVVYEGSVPQAEVREHYWRYAVNWMPYAVEHPFNIASCPTKIMDALASGRPFLASDIPEVRLYPNHIHIARTPEEAAAGLRALLRLTETHDAKGQVAYAATQTWEHRADEMLTLLEKAGQSASLAVPIAAP